MRARRNRASHGHMKDRRHRNAAESDGLFVPPPEASTFTPLYISLVNAPNEYGGCSHVLLRSVARFASAHPCCPLNETTKRYVFHVPLLHNGNALPPINGTVILRMPAHRSHRHALGPIETSRTVPHTPSSVCKDRGIVRTELDSSAPELASHF